MIRSIKPVLTNDGSYTLAFEEINEHYHSIDGAISESQYVFIDNGLELLDSKKPLRILEIGLGTGYNALLSLKWAIKNKCKVTYTSLEPHPLDNDIIEFLAENLASLRDFKNAFQIIHSSQDDTFFLSPFFSIQRLTTTVEAFNPSFGEFEIIFFDAFAPSRQADIWSLEIFKRCYAWLKPLGMIVSYNASGIYKRGLLNAGFDLVRRKGFSSKREMFSGIKSRCNNIGFFIQ